MSLISSTVKGCGRKRLRMAAGSKKRTPGATIIKELSEQSYPHKQLKLFKDRSLKSYQNKESGFKALLENRSSSNSQSRYSET